VQALLFDVFGTVVDWRSSIVEDLSKFGAAKGLKADWTDLRRRLARPLSTGHGRGARGPASLDDPRHSAPREPGQSSSSSTAVSGLSEADKDHVNRVWHRLKPWPDAVEGLTRLKSRYIIGTLSNGNVGLLTRMAKHGRLPWDVILGAETARAYKPQAAAYLAAPRLLNLAPGKVMLGGGPQRRSRRRGQSRAAHGLRRPPAEHGPHRAATSRQTATGTSSPTASRPRQGDGVLKDSLTPCGDSPPPCGEGLGVGGNPYR
jgi:2-haloacid dehalogenase